MDITEFERAVYGRQQRAALDQLHRLLPSVARGDLQVSGSPALATAAPAYRVAVYSRVAAAVAALFTDPDTTLTPRDLERLLLMGGWLDNLFRASLLRSSDGVIRLLPGFQDEKPAAEQLDDAQRRMKFLALFGLDSAVPCDTRFLRTLPAPLRLQVFLRHLTSKPVGTAEGHARREELLETAEALELAPLPLLTDYLVLLANAFMMCSYADHPRRHGVKPFLNRCLRDWLLRFGLKDAELPASRPLKDRPVMAVLAEVMHSRHVQYRYFGQWLRQLRGRFRLVLVTEKSQVDDANRPLFDEVFAFERTSDGRYLTDVVRFVRQLQPDMVFYPSVGMKHWGAALANLRLAPVQFTALGHSASTFCPTVDYYVIEEGYVSDPALLGETVVILPDSSLRFERYPGLKLPAPQIRERAEPVRIALPSNLLKLNPNFLATLRQIREQSPRPLEFHVFPNVAGLEADAGRAAIQAWLPGARVYGLVQHTHYLERLNQCDLNLSPFPFGGLHSVVDSLAQGIPVVAMEGAEPHARTDAMILRLVGMPERLIGHSPEEYSECALRLISDDSERVALSRQALSLDVSNRLFGDETTPLGSDIVDAVWWMYQNHETIQQAGRKAWTAADRAAG